MTVGEKIHYLRTKHHMTMDDLARELGVQRSAINKYEKGIVVNLKRSTISSLCRVFNVSSSYFLDDDLPLEPDPSVDIDQARLEALHQDPRLGLLFDRTRRMTHDDVEFMIQFADRILDSKNNE